MFRSGFFRSHLSRHRMTRFASLVVLVCLATITSPLLTQPLLNPYPFAMPDSMDLDPSLVIGAADQAGARGRIVVEDGHFVDPDGERFRIVGTTIRLGGCFPDSAAAIRIARRLRALGINTVQFFQFDYTAFQPVSILADGASTLGPGLSEPNVDRLDWFTHQLKEHGIYYAFVFHSVWIPRAEDGVRQPDSTGLGARTPVFFDPAIQRIHRGIMELLLTHENPYTGMAYKDDPALLYVMPFEDPSLSLYWVFSRDVVRDTDAGDPTVGLAYHALMDSLYQEHLVALGYASDAAIDQAWSTAPSNSEQQVRNGGFEDPFDQASWQFFVSNGAGAQAVLQYTQDNVAEGEYAAHVLIGNPSGNRGAIVLTQALAETQNKHKYRLSLKARTQRTKWYTND